MVCGSIGYGGINRIYSFYKKLEKEGFKTINHIEESEMDYSNIKDFRNRKKLTKKIVEHDLKYVRESDVMIVISGKPSYGTGIEMYVAKKLGKKVIFYAPKPIPTPWPLHHSDYVVRNDGELLKVLKKLRDEKPI